jgi:energy-coupling factor transporter ATP-binding protein EcfA2
VLVDGRMHGPRSWPATPDPRRLAFGPEESAALLADPGDAGMLLLERPVDGLTPTDADAVLELARERAAEGRAVVLTVDGTEEVRRHASTVALFVAGRLLSWGAPPVALVPAVHFLAVGTVGTVGATGVLGAGREAAQAGSIITSST